MIEDKMRSFIYKGKRKGIKLDPATWQAVDYLAKQRGVKWPVLAHEWVAGLDESAGDNFTRQIRASAMDVLLTATVFNQERSEELERMNNHPLMANSGMINDEQLEEITAAGHVAGSCEFGGFTVLYGTDESEQDCIWIKNGMRDGMHFAFVIPGRIAP